MIWVLRDGKLIEKRLAPPLNPCFGTGPAIHADFAEPVQCMADGKYYGGKRKYLDTVKAHGCEVVGTDFDNLPMKNPEYQPKGLREVIKRSAGQL